MLVELRTGQVIGISWKHTLRYQPIEIGIRGYIRFAVFTPIASSLSNTRLASNWYISPVAELYSYDIASFLALFKLLMS
jgi:hypothetical protein